MPNRMPVCWQCCLLRGRWFSQNSIFLSDRWDFFAPVTFDARARGLVLLVFLSLVCFLAAAGFTVQHVAKHSGPLYTHTSAWGWKMTRHCPVRFRIDGVWVRSATVWHIFFFCLSTVHRTEGLNGQLNAINNVMCNNIDQSRCQPH